MNPLKSLRQRYVELSEPYRLLLQLKAVTGGFSRSLLLECLREAGVQPPRGQVWNAGDIRTALHTLRQMGLTDDKDRVVAEFEHDLYRGPATHGPGGAEGAGTGGRHPYRRLEAAPCRI